MNYWLLLEKSNETRISKGIDGYKDSTGESYHYDSLVPNHRNVNTDDFVVIRKENEIIGVGTIGEILETDDTKIHRRCPVCISTDIRERWTKHPRFKCGKCAEEFSKPNETIKEVRSFVANIKNFTKLNSPPSVKAVKMCARNGVSSQLSMLRLDPSKVLTVFEGIEPSRSSRSYSTEFGVQGFGLSQAERKAVENRAMQVARALYEDTGWELVDMSLSQPFDFLATKGSHKKRFIEVKGTTGEGLSVVLTHGEVNHILNNPATSALVIVSKIILEQKNGKWVAQGGIASTHKDPWKLDIASLYPTQYRFHIK